MKRDSRKTSSSLVAIAPAGEAAGLPLIVQKLTGYSAAAVLLAFFWVMAVSTSRDFCPTFDEVFHLTAGYARLYADDARLLAENGMLAQVWAAVPLWVGGYQFPLTETPQWHASDTMWLVGMFFYRVGNDPDQMLLLGRGMIALLTVAMGFVVYAWSRRLFGQVGGMLSLVLFVFCPTMLSHGMLITTDAAASLFFLLAVGSLWWLMQRMTWWRLLLAGLCLGGLFLGKMTAALIVPMAALMAVGRLMQSRELEALGRWTLTRRWQQAVALGLAGAVLGLMIWAAIWVGFGFRFVPGPAWVPGQDDYSAPGWEGIYRIGESRVLTAVHFAREHHLLPETYLYGIGQVVRGTHGRFTFLNGEFAIFGFRAYFPYCLMVKTPLGLFVVLVLSGLAWLYRRRAESGTLWDRLRAGGEVTAPLWTLLLVYWAVAIFSRLNIGQRHLMPTYPVMYILAGGAAYWVVAQRRWLQTSVLAVAVLWFIVASLSVRPYYLAYFNELVGGPANGYRHLADSNVDWGQDLPGLRRWLKTNNADRRIPVYIDYWGNGDLGSYGIEGAALPAVFSRPDMPPGGEDVGGLYCVSVNRVCGLYTRPPASAWTLWHERHYQELVAALRGARPADVGALSWELKQMRIARLSAYLRKIEPIAQVGYSINIYRLSDAEVKGALFGPPAELIGRETSPLAELEAGL